MTLSPLARVLEAKRLLIFDLDGTLVDSSPLHARAFSEAFAPLGVTVDYSRIAGMTTKAAVQKLDNELGLGLDPGQREELVVAKRDAALALMRSELAPIDGSLEFVAAARQRYRVALASSGSRSSVQTALQVVGLAGVFSPIMTADDVTHGKPHPEAFLTVLHECSVQAEEALIFEDADSGIAAAKAAGIDHVRIGGRNAPGTGWAKVLTALREIAA